MMVREGETLCLGCCGRRMREGLGSSGGYSSDARVKLKCALDLTREF